MKIVELKCKKCGYEFTRLVKSETELKGEKCLKCGGEVKKVKAIELGKPGKGCSSCGGCGGGRKK